MWVGWGGLVVGAFGIEVDKVNVLESPKPALSIQQRFSCSSENLEAIQYIFSLLIFRVSLATFRRSKGASVGNGLSFASGFIVVSFAETKPRETIFIYEQITV
jgi:hypothetical protein